MKLSGKTDLALERHRADPTVKGTSLTETRRGAMTVTRLSVKTDAAAREIERPKGRYTTVSFPDLLHLDARTEEDLVSVLALELSALAEAAVGAAPRDGRRVLLVGLGNRALTADAIGPMTLDRIGATGQLETSDPLCLKAIGCASLFCNIPGVLADSGLEAADTVYLLSRRLSPELVIVVDALAARDATRLCTTVQLSDSGISPGSGIGNRRPGITKEILGVPVLSIGIPTVIDASILGKEDELELFVTLKDVDARLRRLAPILAKAIAEHLALPRELLTP